ncbi:MAG: hypothetical protein R3195_04865 [Gemmatimonadota bacterium]|nr:hypothetical protein [Gemmatimonadota bacterium]
MWDDIDLVPGARRGDSRGRRPDRRNDHIPRRLDRANVELLLLVLASLVAGLLGLMA